MGSVTWRKRGHRYQVSWRLDDGSQGAKTVDSADEARRPGRRETPGAAPRHLAGPPPRPAAVQPLGR